MMTHQPGATTRVGIDPHLGQKPKLGGRYADDSLIYISYFVGPLYIHFLLSLLFSFLFLFPKHKKTKNISVVSLYLFLYLSTFGLLYLLFLVWYLKNPKIFCFVRYFLSLLFQKLETQIYLLFFFSFVKFVAKFSLSLLH
jgi:hypothetical protein